VDDYVWVFPGRQIVTKENIEVLSLLAEDKIPERESIYLTIQRILDAGGLPTLCWAPGKWSGARGDFVRGVLRSDIGARIFLGDSAMRCFPIPRPDVFSSGRPIFAGTDPLPLPGEEKMIGTYCLYAPIEFDNLRSLRENLRRSLAVEQIGARCSPLHAVSRYVRNEWRRRHLPMEEITYGK